MTKSFYLCDECMCIYYIICTFMIFKIVTQFSTSLQPRFSVLAIDKAISYEKKKKQNLPIL